MLRETLRFLIYILYCIQGGLFLTLVPWSTLWSRNAFFVRFPDLGLAASSPIVRGLVSGIGAALLLHGAAEIVEVLFPPRPLPPAPPRPPRGTEPE